MRVKKLGLEFNGSFKNSLNIYLEKEIRLIFSWSNPSLSNNELIYQTRAAYYIPELI